MFTYWHILNAYTGSAMKLIQTYENRYYKDCNTALFWFHKASYYVGMDMGVYQSLSTTYWSYTNFLKFTDPTEVGKPWTKRTKQ